MPCCCGDRADVVVRRAADDEFAHLFGDGEDLVDADALVVAGTAAQVAAGTAPELGREVFAATAFEERHLLDRGDVRLDTVRAVAAHEALADDAQE